MAVQPASLEVLEKAAVPPAQARVELRTELRQDMAGLRHSFELRLASTVTQPQLCTGLLGQMALLLGIAYCFVTYPQH